MLAFRAQTRNLGVPRMGKDPMDARAQRSVFRISGASGVGATIERVPFCGFAARCRININNPSEKGPASKAAARRLTRAAESQAAGFAAGTSGTCTEENIFSTVGA